MRESFFRELRTGIRNQMLESALKGYSSVGGAHLPMDTEILKKALDSQLRYADRFENSGDRLDPFRIGMYAREADHIGRVVGAQQAFFERGAKRWRRILHPEDSKTGPCPFCTADAEITHPIEMPFFDHPNGVCTAQGVLFETEDGSLELPVPGFNPHSFVEYIRELFGNIKSVVRRFRR